MQVSELTKGSVGVLELDGTLVEVAREMEDNSLSALGICEDGLLVGIITERDLVRAAADGVSFSDTPIEEYMTVSPNTIPQTGTTEHALRMMLDGGFRHVPVVNDDGEIVGLLTMRDVVRSLYAALVQTA